MSRIELITGHERRRPWSDAQKRMILAEAFAPGAVVAEVARRADVGPGQIYRWRRELREAPEGFSEVVVAPAAQAACNPGAIEVEFARGVRVRIPQSISADLAVAIIQCLSRR